MKKDNYILSDKMSKGNILILNYEYPPLGGGGGIAAKKLAEAFVALGYEVDYVTSSYKELAFEEIINGVNVYRVPVLARKEKSNATMISLISFPVCAYRKTVKLCRSKKYIFINTHFAVPTGPLGVRVSLKFGVPNILSIHGGDIYDPTKKFSPHKWWIFRDCIKNVLNRSDYVIAQSNNTKSNAEKYYPNKNKIDVIPLPYENIDFIEVPREELEMDPDAIYLISVGRMVKRKGYDNLLKALAEINDNKVKLIIIGEGPEKETLLQIIKDENLGNRVLLPGFVTEDVKFQYLKCADLYVLSSVHEGFGIVLQEAMQVGLPILATNYGGQTDIIEDRINGLLVEGNSVDALVNGIKQMLENKELMARCSQENLKKVQEFHAENIAKRYIHCISQIKK